MAGIRQGNLPRYYGRRVLGRGIVRGGLARAIGSAQECREARQALAALVRERPWPQGLLRAEALLREIVAWESARAGDTRWTTSRDPARPPDEEGQPRRRRSDHAGPMGLPDAPASDRKAVEAAVGPVASGPARAIAHAWRE